MCDGARPKGWCAVDDVREQLRVVDEELAGLRRQAEEIRASVGGRASGAMDLADSAAAITAAEEQGGRSSTSSNSAGRACCASSARGRELYAGSANDRVSGPTCGSALEAQTDVGTS